MIVMVASVALAPLLISMSERVQLGGNFDFHLENMYLMFF